MANQVFIGVRYGSWRRARRARALGAVPVFESCGKLFGDIDVIRKIQENERMVPLVSFFLFST